MSELPPGWTQAPLAAIADVQLGRQRSPKNHFGPNMRSYMRAANVTWDGLALGDVNQMNFSPTEMETFRLRPGDILLSEASGSASEVGKPALWLGEIEECYFQNTLLRVRARKAEPSYLFWLFKWLALSGQFAKRSRGVGIHHLGAKTLSAWNIPLAPDEEQKRIVAAIEEEFSRVDAGVAALARAEIKLKRLRDLLPLQLLRGDGSMESEWQTLAQLSEHIVDCPHSTPKFSAQGMPCIDTTCISPGVIHRDRIRHVDAATYIERVRRLTPQCGDMIFAREGTVGTAVLVPEDLAPCLGQRVMLFRPIQQKVRSDYLCLVVNSEIAKRQYRAKLLGSTVPHLNVRDAKELRIPVPELSTQKNIAERADEVLSNLSFVNNAIGSKREESSALRSSILAAAFAGKLT